MELDLPEDIVLQVDCLVYRLQTEKKDMIRPLREAMHVQSISHWAPANIGPYSQAIKVYIHLSTSYTHAQIGEHKLESNYAMYNIYIYIISQYNKFICNVTIV